MPIILQNLPPVMAHTDLMRRIEDDMWASIQAMRLPLPQERFNPFPGTVFSAEDVSNMSDGAFYEPAGGRAFCNGSGWYLVRSKDGAPSHSLIGVAPARLSSWSRVLLSDDTAARDEDDPAFQDEWTKMREHLSVFVALHELAHGYMRKEMRFFAFTNMRRSEGQKTLIRETFGDIAALNAMLGYYPRKEVLAFAGAFAAYRAENQISDPHHDSSSAILRWIGDQRALRHRPNMNLTQVYQLSMRTFRYYLPASLPEIKLGKAGRACPAPTQRGPVPTVQSASVEVP